MLPIVKTFYDQFNVSARRVENLDPPTTAFEKFHVQTLDWRTPIAAAAVYILVVNAWSAYNRSRLAKSKAEDASSRISTRSRKSNSNLSSNSSSSSESMFTPFKLLVIAHNIFLCLYSLIACLSVLPLLVQPYFQKPALQAFCDADKSTYFSGINFWVWNFYVSKYYELVDTAILLLKGKPSSFLQTFHHAGSIVGMWIMTTTHAPAGWIFVLFNSFIHTIMYLYYTLTCLGYRPTWKKYLTRMQIIQFLVGNPLGIVYAFMPNCLSSHIPSENVIGKLLGSQTYSLYACLIVNTVFISGLVVLFTDFSRKTYGSETAKAPGSRKGSAPKSDAKKIKPASEKAAPKKETKEAKKSTAATEVKNSAAVKDMKKPAKESKRPAAAKETKKSAAKASAQEAAVPRRTGRSKKLD